MLSNFLSDKISSFLPFSPTDEQRRLILALSAFIFNRDPSSVFVLRGYAGTGKTSVIAALIRAMLFFRQRTTLLAPTGRAAKVMAAYAGSPAYTIHKKIYRQKTLGEPSFALAQNLSPHTFFIIDEASMISNGGDSETSFGSGRLLDDLISFIYCGNGCRMLLIGDDAQLPPVGQDHSPALELNRLLSAGLSPTEFSLTQVVRQNQSSGILFNATAVRHLIDNSTPPSLPRLSADPFSDVIPISGAQLIECLNDEYARTGLHETIVITRANWQALQYNQGIRHQVLQRDDEIGNGDLIMITRNNYFWSQDYDNIEFLANGDIAEVTRIRSVREIYGLRFADLSLRLLDYDCDIDARILLDALYADTPQKVLLLQNQLFQAVAEDYAHISNRRERFKQMAQDPYFNALQVKFAYAVTCHKAQGGQWNTVFVDQGLLSKEQDSDYFHWLYTALTRATSRLYLVNFPDKCFT